MDMDACVNNTYLQNRYSNLE
uniref:Uncharacterized protein n=1 Tax=Rhizophora mucronata TaxID=61149 RepID=A0A2P2N5H1_RHIMU